MTDQLDPEAMCEKGLDYLLEATYVNGEILFIDGGESKSPGNKLYYSDDGDFCCRGCIDKANDNAKPIKTNSSGKVCSLAASLGVKLLSKVGCIGKALFPGTKVTEFFERSNLTYVLPKLLLFKCFGNSFFGGNLPPSGINLYLCRTISL